MLFAKSLQKNISCNETPVTNLANSNAIPTTDLTTIAVVKETYS